MPLLAQELGFPWVVRKCAIKYGSLSTDIVRQKGGTLSVTSVNAKGSWTRAFQEGRDTVVVRALPAPLHCKGFPESGLTTRGGMARFAAQRRRRALQGQRALGRRDPQSAPGAAHSAGVGGHDATRAGLRDLALHGRRADGGAQCAAHGQGPRDRHVLVPGAC